LDEPTNHLDLPSCDLLEEALQAYPGTVILVTHDRHLIRNVAETLVEVRDGKVAIHDGVDEALLMPGDNAIPAKLSAGTKPAKSHNKKRSGSSKKQEKRSQAEQRNQHHQSTKSLRIELRKAEKDWEKAENKVAELQAQLADPEIYDDGERVGELAKAFDAAKDKAAKLSTRWEELASKLERLS
jgi:ATP-binding cassette subfamily F protein 3